MELPNPLPPTEPGFIWAYHEGLDQATIMPESALPEWASNGWRRLVDDDIPPAEPAKEPPPVTRSQAAKAKAAKAQDATRE